MQCFSSVVGPNGSGKSNVIDAMLFVFGRRAKQVRCSPYHSPPGLICTSVQAVQAAVSTTTLLPDAMLSMWRSAGQAHDRHVLTATGRLVLRVSNNSKPTTLPAHPFAG
jgi:ABC-type Mn2+/Zn2+ transport system ATPase subunit